MSRSIQKQVLTPKQEQYLVWLSVPKVSVTIPVITVKRPLIKCSFVPSILGILTVETVLLYAKSPALLIIII